MDDCKKLKFVEFCEFICWISHEVFKENSLVIKHGLHISIDMFLDKVLTLADQQKAYSFFYPTGELKNLDHCVDDEEEVTGYFTY